MEDDRKPLNNIPNEPEIYHPPQQEGGLYEPPVSREDLRLQEERRLRTETARMELARKEAVVNRAVNIVYYLVGALLILLALRFILRLFGANQENLFASVIYDFSAPFVAPFSTLFISPAFREGASIFDVNLIVAMLVYALLGWLVGRFIRLIWEP